MDYSRVSETKDLLKYYKLYYSKKYINDILMYSYEFKNKNSIKRNKILIFLLLYLTGVNIEKILKFKIHHLKELIEFNSCLLLDDNTIYLIKICKNISFKKFDFLYYDLLDKKNNCLLFCSYKNENQPLRKNNILSNINLILLNFNLKYKNELNFDTMVGFFSNVSFSEINLNQRRYIY